MIGHSLSLTIGSNTPMASAFHPAKLFANGEEGAVFDVTPAHCGVTPNNTVTTLSDASGRGHHATQANAAARPILRQSGALHYLEFDGVNDALQTGVINLGASDAVTVIVGLRKLGNSSAAMALEFSSNAYANAGAFYLTAPEGTGAASDYRFYARGTVSPSSTLSTGAAPAPDTCVLTGLADISNASRTLRRNGVQVASSASALGIGNWRSFPLNLGSRAGTSLFFNGWIYGAIVINRLLTAEELAAAEEWMAAKCGVTLP